MSLRIQHHLLAAGLFVVAMAAGRWLSGASEPLATMPEIPKVSAKKFGAPGGAMETAQPGARSAHQTATETSGAADRSQAWPPPSAQALRAWAAARAGAPVATRAAPVARAAVRAPAPAPVASAPPRAPAPAWRFVGRIADGGSVRAMLLTAQQLRVVSERDLIDKDWRVERIGEQGVELLWLPGEQRVQLAWAAS